MARYLVYGQYLLNNVESVIGCVHLESLGNQSFRKKQLEICFDTFDKYDNAFLMGDCNYDWYSENKNVRKEYYDVWKVLHPDDPGYTMPRTT
eukprot:CAMPEP_0114596190 /NCGR_PEP_ID=MMETSP0125-20121206/18146_1 /TAXON_ID=485358 ORGANISM="Aristerostoma sp., Strain ATCC 50986" /NCGR_SAMPLE_ID=MMETSP0125 /ASSEMBLY_ACC=CAM_ASM_000245 /LENGTH=91 /DNA_ID=CAMNT_0001798845 /DNA_START=315 /DNA_END=590 /DNA_ORIENTATION=+